MITCRNELTYECRFERRPDGRWEAQLWIAGGDRYGVWGEGATKDAALDDCSSKFTQRAGSDTQFGKYTALRIVDVGGVELWPCLPK